MGLIGSQTHLLCISSSVGESVYIGLERAVDFNAGLMVLQLPPVSEFLCLIRCQGNLSFNLLVGFPV